MVHSLLDFLFVNKLCVIFSYYSKTQNVVLASFQKEHTETQGLNLHRVYAAMPESMGTSLLQR